MRTITKQANFRLPEPLLDDLREVSEQFDKKQSEIVREAVREKVSELKEKLSQHKKNAIFV